MIKRWYPIVRNFYFLTGFGFLVWMVFFDSSDLISRFKLTARYRSLEREKEFYEEKIKEVEKDREELMNNRELIEKYAREKYLMKRHTEDIFVLR